MNLFKLNNRTFQTLALVLSAISCSVALECYVCTEQEGNVEKCLSTVRTCNSTQDTCLTEVRWGSTPYWSQGAEKQYYVTKTCASRKFCEQRRDEFISYCHRIWYEDWKCAECCQGDRCNYYVFLGAGSVHASWITLGVSILGILGCHRFMS